MNNTIFKLIAIVGIALSLFSCSENYSNGERIGLVTQFSKRGMVWKTWEGHLNITQTGMNSADGFDFSIDSDNEKETTVRFLDSAASYGWKVKLIYHETYGKNLFQNRGETNHFIDSVIVVDKNFSTHENNSNLKKQDMVNGKIIDTIYVVITPDNPDYKKFFK
jgi:acid stress-induced BolA-like protein IbaG/YrbA